MNEGVNDEGRKLSPPSRVIGDRYDLETELGRGGSGIVWAAYDRVTSERVALKIMTPQASSVRTQFFSNVEATRTLRHPHLVEVLDWGEDQDGPCYLVMECLFGTTLASLIDRVGPLPQLRAIRIVTQILEAVAASHRMDIVHRDLKPANVMLVHREEDGDFVKVCDLGLAKRVIIDHPDGESHLALSEDPIDASFSHQEEICGTPGYMSPEQVRGGPLDGRADLYSVAVILFHAILGRLPFEGQRTAVLSMQLGARPPRPRLLRPDLSIFPPLENLILRTLSKDPADRPSTAEVFRTDLMQIARDYSRRHIGAAAAPGDAETIHGKSSGRLRPRLMRIGIAAVAAAAMGGLSSRALLSKDVGAGSTAEKPGTGIALATSAETSTERSRPAVESESPLRATERARFVRPPAPVTEPEQQSTRSRSHRPSSPTDRSTAADLLKAPEAVLASGHPREACARALAVARLMPRLPAVWEFLGRCFMRLPDPTRAHAYYRKYLELDPAGPRAAFVSAIVDEGPL